MFTREEIGILFEALDAWEKQKSNSAMLGSFLSMALIKDKDEAQKSVDEQLKEARDVEQMRKEQSIMLKAKLLQMRDSVEASNFWNDALKR